MFWQKWDLNSCLLVLELVSILPSSTKVIVDKSVVNVYLFIHSFILAFRDKVSVCDSDCLGTHSVAPAGLELTEFHLSSPPQD